MNPSRFASGAAVGGWKELGRTTLGSTANTINVTGISNKRYYMILFDHVHSTNQHGAIWNFNADTESNYAVRYEDEGGTDATAVSQASLRVGHGGETNYGKFDVGYLSNLLAKEKLLIVDSANTSIRAASTAPLRSQSVGKWTNTTENFDEFLATCVGTGDFGVSDEVVVLGWDPADTHTDNFWTELASVELGSPNSVLSSGTITAKKYLWVQAYITGTSASANALMRFNSDSGANYSDRGSIDGAADGTNTGSAFINTDQIVGTLPRFLNAFIINNSANEKLVISNMINQGTAGAGTAPQRNEIVGKWDNTASQITNVSLNTITANTYSTGSIIKVWGSD